MLKAEKGPADILAFGETVKKFLSNRTPTGASNKQISEAADKFFQRSLRMSEARTVNSRRQVHSAPSGACSKRPFCAAERNPLIKAANKKHVYKRTPKRNR